MIESIKRFFSLEKRLQAEFMRFYEGFVPSKARHMGSTKEDIERLYREHIEAKYKEPGRYYHDLSHVEHCLKQFKKIRHFLHTPISIEAAIWFHDIVYDANKKDNEKKSAEYASLILKQLGFGQNIVNIVVPLIMQTDYANPPKPPEYDIQYQWLQDIDLSIIAGSWYFSVLPFEKNVRKEYAHVDDETYRKKRIEILRGILKQHRLFKTEYFHGKLEKKGRANLRRLIKKLSE